MDERTPKQRAGQRARRDPHYRRVGDPEYARAFLMASSGIRAHIREHQDDLGTEAGRGLRTPTEHATDAGDAMERVLDDILGPVQEFVESVGADVRQDASPALPLGAATKRDLAADLVVNGDSERDEVLFAEATCYRLKQRGHAPKEVALFAEACLRSARAGRDVDELRRLATASELVSLLPDQPPRLVSFLDAYLTLIGPSNKQAKIQLPADRAYLSYVVTREVLAGRLEGLVAAAVYDRVGTMIALEAFTEAHALVCQLDEALRDPKYPDELTDGLFDYYLARRSEDDPTLAKATAALFFGRTGADEPDGPVYRSAHKRYLRLREVDRELAAEAYFEGFCHALRRLPVEALVICPGLAIRYAYTAAEHAGDRIPSKLGRMVAMSDEGVDHQVGSQVHATWVAAESVSPSSTELPPYLAELPDVDLYLRYVGRDATRTTVAQLAAEWNVSRATIYERVKRFQVAAQAAVAAGVPVARGKRAHAVRVLRDVLRDGPKLRSDVVTAAGAAGVSERTLDRAASQVGVTGKGARSDRTWSLPGSASGGGPTI